MLILSKEISFPRVFQGSLFGGLLLGLSFSCSPAAPAQSAGSPQVPVAEPSVAAEKPVRRTPQPRTWTPATKPHNVQATVAARKHLLQRLKKLGDSPAFALGHEDTTAYGVGWDTGFDRSDIKSVCGSHAGVYGWELFRLETEQTKNGDDVDFGRLQKMIANAYERGGINTISWHVDNPLTGGDAWDKTPAVAASLPGGSHHELFVTYLSRIADYLDALRGPQGERIPILFRPFHEHTGDWFWWGSTQTDEAGYIALFRFTVDYLRRERGLDNLLFAFSPDGGRVFKKEDQLFRYPGDDYVDVIGLDYYFDPGQERFPQLLTWLVEQAEAHGKVAALTEFGPRGGVNGKGIETDFLSKKVLQPLLETPGALKIAYALAWRNARPDHAYYSYPGHAGEGDLKGVCEHPAVLLTSDLAAKY